MYVGSKPVLFQVKGHTIKRPEQLIHPRNVTAIGARVHLKFREWVVEPRRAMPDWFLRIHSFWDRSLGLLGLNFHASQGIFLICFSVNFLVLGGQNWRQGCSLAGATVLAVLLIDRVVCTS
jgi:hypothetical protein